MCEKYAFGLSLRHLSNSDSITMRNFDKVVYMRFTGKRSGCYPIFLIKYLVLKLQMLHIGLKIKKKH